MDIAKRITEPIGEMIENAQSRRWIENKDEKHNNDIINIKKEASTPL